MDVDQLLYHYLTDGIAGNHKNHVGLELEYPIVSVDGGPIHIPALRGMLAALEGIGYRVVRTSSDGTPIMVKDELGNAVTFDTCYENLEYVSASAPSMPPLYRRFRETLKTAQESLRRHGHMILGIGYNPLMERHEPHMLQSELTLAINRFFHSHAGITGHYRDFYCRISSEQVHFNATPEEIPPIFECFTRLDWLNILLFSDSPAICEGTPYLCARNELYARSFFRRLGLVGAQDMDVRTLEDITRSYRELCLFMRHRNGKAEVFEPVAVESYFSQPRYGAMEEDIHCLDIERNIVTTSYGTIEYRMLCSQPFWEAFSPSAFNLGLRVMLPQALALARGFDEAHQLPAPNRRNEAASKGVPAFAPRKDMEEYAKTLTELSRQGLVQRGYGEEAFLAPLLARSDIFDSPALRFRRDAKALGVRAALLKRGEVGDGLM